MNSNSSPVANLIPGLPWTRRISPKTVVMVLGALALFDLVFYLVAVQPLSDREAEQQILISSLETQIANKKTALETTVVAAERLDDADTEGEELISQITLDRSSAFSQLLTELGGAANEAGVEVRETAYEVESVDGSDNYGILSINANFRGQYENLVRLLNVLDRSELFFIIGSLGASPRSDSDSNELQINMRVDTFVRNL